MYFILVFCFSSFWSDCTVSVSRKFKGKWFFSKFYNFLL